MFNHRSARSSIAIIGGAVLLALSQVACSSGSDSDSDSGSSKSMTYAGFGGITQEVQSETQLKPFAEETGIKITETEPAEFAKLKVMVESGNVSWDVIDGNPYMTIPNCGTLFEPLDYDVIDTSNIPKEMISKCSAPMYLSAQMLFYNGAKFTGTNTPKSWADFFDTKKFPGKRGIGNSANSGALEAALLADGVAPADLYPLDYKRALEKLDTIKDSLVYWSTGAEQQQQMESGQVDLMMGWPGRAYGAEENGASFEPMWDATLSVYDVFAVPKGAPNKANAMKWINYALGAEPQKNFADKVPYAAVRTDVKPSADKQIDKYAPTLAKQDKYKFVAQDQKWWGDNLDEMVKVWTAWTAG